MDEVKCKQYLERIERDSSSVGVQIPDSMTVNGNEIPLNKIAFDVSNNGELPSSYDMSLDEVKVSLRRERNQIVESIEECTVETEVEAEQIVKKVRQLDRALNAMTNPSETDLESKLKRKEAVKEKKWQEFLRKIRGESNKRR